MLDNKQAEQPKMWCVCAGHTHSAVASARISDSIYFNTYPVNDQYVF